MKYNHMPYGARIRLFFRRKKAVFFTLFVLYATFTIWGNAMCYWSSVMERSFKSLKKRWIARKYPHCMAWSSAFDTQYEPKNISRQTTDKLSELFVKVDRETPGGATFKLVSDTLVGYVG